ncbi:MAG: 23S rRNA (guanosine(2251)-2'-O)-methyltransferase RlmB [Thermomicrobiales bacterium]|nr:23S rRNA (guanosine(2251)-2'-O)-methyltransferase RlmB [Thermomicrobiales bacterium]
MKTPAKGRSGSPRNPGQPSGPHGRTARPANSREQQAGKRPQGANDRGPRRNPDDAPRPQRKRSPGIQIRGDLLYGRNAVRESLRAGRRTFTRLFIADGVKEDERVEETIQLAKERGALLERVPRMLLDDLTRGGNHQGVGLEAGEFLYSELEEIIEEPGTILIMDHLNDPQNFGTLMRAADAVGVAGIVLPQDRSVSVTPAVVNSSAGAVEHLRVAMTPNLARALDKIEESGRWIVGLDEDETGNNIFTIDVPTPVGLVLGAEGSGLSPIVRKRCQVILSLPMRGAVDSLNAATAGSIVLYDLLRREITES